MFNSSLRRVARTCPNATLSTRPSSSHGSIAAFTTRSRSRQRRHSSSKPPIPPNNGSPPIPTTSVKQVGAPRSDKQPSTDSRLSKRKITKSEKSEAVKQQDEHFSEWTRTLPSVPSTQHINPKGKDYISISLMAMINMFHRCLRSVLLLNPPTDVYNRSSAAGNKSRRH